MKKIIMLAFLLCGFITGYGQCKYAKGKQIEKKSKNWPINIQAMTKDAILFSKQSSYVGVGNFFIDENNEYFLSLYLSRQRSPNFEIQENHQMDISFENNIDLSLVSCFNSKSKSSPVGLTKYVSTYYKLTKEQVEIFVNNQIVNYNIYFSTNKNIINSSVDEKGSFFEYELKKLKNNMSLMEPATCILQYVSK